MALERPSVPAASNLSHYNLRIDLPSTTLPTRPLSGKQHSSGNWTKEETTYLIDLYAAARSHGARSIVLHFHLVTGGRLLSMVRAMAAGRVEKAPTSF